MEIFLTTIVVWEFFQFIVVVHESCSTCRCIFDVFVERGELYILLLHHLVLLLGKKSNQGGERAVC